MNTYSPFWHKYRPAVLRMMVDSAQEPQSYQLSVHEFKALNPRQKGGYSFCLVTNNGKAVSGIKGSDVARDLWDLLNLSPRGAELLSEGSYEFSMNKEFKLTISRVTVPAE